MLFKQKNVIPLNSRPKRRAIWQSFVILFIYQRAKVFVVLFIWVKGQKQLEKTKKLITRKSHSNADFASARPLVIFIKYIVYAFIMSEAV